MPALSSYKEYFASSQKRIRNYDEGCSKSNKHSSNKSNVYKKSKFWNRINYGNTLDKTIISEVCLDFVNCQEEKV